MPVIDHRGVLKGLRVKEAMRRQVIQLPAVAPLAQVIRATIKYKVNAVLIVNEEHKAAGVVSKTDLMGAYYAALDLTTPASDVMVGPPLFCQTGDSLESALNLMQTKRVHRLYVCHDEVPEQTVGVLAYPDILGLLYRFCHRCERGRRGGNARQETVQDYLTVREVMTPDILAGAATDSLVEIMEGLAAYRIGAALIRDEAGRPAGVVSKTDLIVAYKHGVAPATPAGAVMNMPVQACEQETFLDTALKQMIFSDIHRLFVYKRAPEHLVGVLALSDVARFRSGTCRACISSRIRIN